MKTAKREDILSGIRAASVSVTQILLESIPESEWEDIANEMLGVLNQIEAGSPRDEFREVVYGSMLAMGFSPIKPPN